MLRAPVVLLAFLACTSPPPPARQLHASLAPFDSSRPHVLYAGVRAEACGPTALADALDRLRAQAPADGYLGVSIESASGRADCVAVSAQPATYGCAPRGRQDAGVARTVRPDPGACGEAAVDFEPGGPCPPTLVRLPASLLDEAFTCTCTGQEEGPAWGSGVYTRDSAVCVAARHAGAVSESGGLVTLKLAPACAAYRGSLQNGVRSLDWGAYGLGTYFFVGHGSGDCAENVRRQDGPPPCPPRYDALPDELEAAAYTCRCDGAPPGSVWGTDRYTRDSAVCTAAAHAGLLDGEVGVVTVLPAGPCPAFRGSARNGVTSGSWGAFPGTFYFGPRQVPRCEAPPK